MIDKSVIRKKIEKEYPQKSERFYKAMLEKINSDCLPEFEQNLLEWCTDKPLSEIKIYDNYTIEMIINKFPFADFPYILTAIKNTRNTEHPELIWEWFVSGHR